MSTATTTTSTTNLLEALRARGVAGYVAERLTRSATPDLIGAWCAYAERARGMGPGAVVEAIRSGDPPPAPPRSRTETRTQATYAHRVIDWLKAKFPDLCDPEPHPAAIATVLRLHQRYGKGTLTVRAHGALIRAAVAGAAHEEARR